MRIGLPRALLYHYYYPLWKSLFEQLGVEIVISDITSKQLVQEGVKVTVPEICLPIKIFNGHIINLLSKEVDYIFIPRFIGVESGKWFCPKFIGLPELADYTIDGVKSKILTVDIQGKKESTCEWTNYRPLCEALQVTPKELKKALKTAERVWQHFRDCCKQGFTIEEAEKMCSEDMRGSERTAHHTHDITLGVLGYVYNVYDPFVSMDIIKKLHEMNVRVITFEMLDEKRIHEKFKRKSKNLYWTFTDKIYGAAVELMENHQIDGLIHITAFGCGPDSIVGKMMELDSEKFKKPFMTIRVDEHTGESHLLTRIEAFVDMIKRQKISERRRELA